MINNLIHKLYPQPDTPKGEVPMTQPQVVNNYHGPVASVGDNNKVAQAAAPQSQAAVGDIHNQGASTAAFESLLDAFLAEVNANPALANKRSYLAERVSELKTLTAETDRGPEASKGVKRLMDDLTMAVDGVEAGVDKASTLIEKLTAAKNVVIASWPQLKQLWDNMGSGS
jgi:hypothetical protein